MNYLPTNKYISSYNDNGGNILVSSNIQWHEKKTKV